MFDTDRERGGIANGGIEGGECVCGGERGSINSSTAGASCGTSVQQGLETLQIPVRQFFRKYEPPSTSGAGAPS